MCLKKLKHTRLHISLCVCVRAYACAKACTLKKEDNSQKCLLFPQKGVAVQISHRHAWVKFGVSGFYICTQTPAVAFSPAHRRARKKHTVRLPSGLSSSLWNAAIR